MANKIKGNLVKHIFKLIKLFHLHKLFRYLTGKTYKQIVICGIPRSGTSLALNLFSSALVNFNVYVDENRKIKKSRESSALKIVRKRGNYITKLPNDLFNIQNIFLRNILNKDLIIIVIMRDFREVITSKHQWGDGGYYLSYNFKKTLDGKIDKNRGLKDYISQIKRIQKYRKNNNIYFIDYQQLINSPDVIIDILNENNIENKGYGYFENFGSVYGNDQKSSMGLKRDIPIKWKQEVNIERVLGEFCRNPVLFDLLEEYGYEKDRKWFNKLKKKRPK